MSFCIGGFPTLKFKPAGSHNFIDYDGDRSSLKSLITFVKEKAKNNLTPKVNAPEQEAQATFAKPSKGHDELWFYLHDLCFVTLEIVSLFRRYCNRERFPSYILQYMIF